MEYRRLGMTGIPVSGIGLGGNTFGRSCGEQESIALVRHAVERGINMIDTADIYSDGLSEEYIGAALEGIRDEVVLGTKTGWPWGEGIERGGLTRRRIVRKLETSLRRLRTDYVDLFYLHYPDPRTPLEESLRALDDLVRQGKVRHAACSNYPAWQVAEMAGIGRAENLARVSAYQAEYSLVDRDPEQGLLDACAHFDIAVVAFAPLASGFLTGKYRRGEPIPAGVRGHENTWWQDRRLTARNYAVAEHLADFAAERGWSIPGTALAWVLAQPTVSCVLVGATNPDQIDANIAAADLSLTAEEAAALGGAAGDGSGERA
jgi:aryl-alcohol dehydrogenase-like predicted oxidoreductase